MITRPRWNADSFPYWQGCLRGELLYQRCDDCGEVVFHPRAACPYCLSDALSWRNSAGQGEVYSFTVQHVPLHPDRAGPSPRVLGIVALAEGYHMFAEIAADDPADVRVGASVQVFFDRVAEDVALPKFRVVG